MDSEMSLEAALDELDLVAHYLDLQGETDDASTVDRARVLAVKGDRQGAIALLATTQCYHRAVMQAVFGKLERALA